MIAQILPHVVEMGLRCVLIPFLVGRLGIDILLWMGSCLWLLLSIKVSINP